MWERRWDPLREEWVIVAAHRQFRPWSSVEVAVQTPRPPAFDPTCYLWDTIGAQQENVLPFFSRTLSFAKTKR